MKIIWNSNFSVDKWKVIGTQLHSLIDKFSMTAWVLPESGSLQLRWGILQKTFADLEWSLQSRAAMGSQSYEAGKWGRQSHHVIKSCRKAGLHPRVGLVLMLSAQLCTTLCEPMDCSPPGSSIHGIFQTRILEWVAVSFSRVSSRPRDQTRFSCISCIGRRIQWWEVDQKF